MFFSGATGDNAAFINGFFEPTQEKGLDGRVLYAKRGDASMCIEHRTGDWEVKTVSNKGKGYCWAHVAGGCGLEACTSRVWRLDDGTPGPHDDAPSVKLVAGAEAERQETQVAAEAHSHVSLRHHFQLMLLLLHLFHQLVSVF